ncbi:MAG: hypothetical protein ACI3W9_07800 [Eubacteriales bacterium]
MRRHGLLGYRASRIVQNAGKRITGLLLAMLLIAAACYMLFGKDSSVGVFAEHSPAIRGVNTEEDVYSVTVLLDGVTESDLRLLLEAFSGYGIKATFFVDAAWASAHNALCVSLAADHSLALLVKTDFSRFSRAEVMNYVAVLNDKFMTATGVYPKYVRYVGNGEGYLPAVLSSYGQYYISAEATMTNTAVQVRAGAILEVVPCGDDTLFALAGTAATAVANSLSPVPLSELLYPAGSEVNANGYQYK